MITQLSIASKSLRILHYILEKYLFVQIITDVIELCYKAFFDYWYSAYVSKMFVLAAYKPCPRQMHINLKLLFH